MRPLSFPFPSSVAGVRPLIATLALTATCLADSAPDPPSTLKIAVIDITVIFQKNCRFNKALSRLKFDVKQLEKATKQQREEQSRHAVKLRRWAPDSPAFQRVESAHVSQAAAAQAQLALQHKQLKRREAMIFANAYQDVRRHVEQHCKRHKIDLVLRYDSRKPNPNSDRQSISKWYRRTVIYQHGLDLTPILLKRINAQKGPRYDACGTSLDPFPKPVRFLATLTGMAVQRVLAARTAWVIDRLIFPPAS